MENLGSILISAVLSGIFATVVTLWWQNKNQIHQEKVRIFSTLMSKRYDITAEDCVQALNMIDVVFYKDEKVRTAWRDFKNATDMPDTEAKPQVITDKRLKMLEVMAKSIGYKDIHWDDIKEYYYPKGLSDNKRDEAVLRRVQIDAAIAQIEKGKDNTAQVDPKEEFGNQMLMKAIENPDGLLKLFEVAEKAQNLNKGPRIRK